MKRNTLGCFTVEALSLSQRAWFSSVLCSSVQNSERGKKIGNAMMTTSRSVVQTGKVVGEQDERRPPSGVELPLDSLPKPDSRSVCGRGFDQRQVGRVVLVFDVGSACSWERAGRAPRRGQTLRWQRPHGADLPLLGSAGRSGQKPGRFLHRHQSASLLLSHQLILTAGDTKEADSDLRFSVSLPFVVAPQSPD